MLNIRLAFLFDILHGEMSMDQEILVNLALDAGAAKATVISTETIVTSRSFRDICASNSCGLYGKCWMCPPDVGDIEVLIGSIRHYTHGLLFQTIAQIEDSYDFEGMMEAGKTHAHVCRKIRESVKKMTDDILLLGGGGCRVCDKCTKLDNLPCRRPDDAIASMEAYGIDVYRTTEPTNLKYINGQNTVTYFGIVLFQGEG